MPKCESAEVQKRENCFGMKAWQHGSGEMRKRESVETQKRRNVEAGKCGSAEAWKCESAKA